MIEIFDIFTTFFSDIFSLINRLQFSIVVGGFSYDVPLGFLIIGFIGVSMMLNGMVRSVKG